MKKPGGKGKSAISQTISYSFRLSQMLWREKKVLTLGLIFLFVIVSASPFLQSGARGFLINELIRIAGHDTVTRNLFWAVLFILAAGILQPLANTIQTYILKLFWFFLDEKIDMMVVEKRGELDIASHESPEISDIINKVDENGGYRIKDFVDRLFVILQYLLSAIIASVIIISVKWWLFLILLIGALPSLMVEAKYGNQIWDIWGAKAEIRRKYWDLRSHFSEIPKLTELKLLQNTKKFAAEIRKVFRDFQSDQKKYDRKRTSWQLVSLIFSQASIIFVILWLVANVLSGAMLIGTLTFILATVGELSSSLTDLFVYLGRQHADSLFVTDTFKFLDSKPIITSPVNSVLLDQSSTPQIVFDNITFTYPRAKKPALQNFSLEIKPGEKVAIVGVNGAGKTTLVKLLFRFYDPQVGKITIDGVDLRELDLNSWYQKIGAIFQDYAHYHLLVRDAIAVGRSDAETSVEEIRSAAQFAEAATFIEEWKDKYETMLGKQFSGGIEPSIGQWQKLALARTFYRDPKLWILDEPTSSIDSEAEARIFEQLQTLPEDRSVILISHRFSTVRKADKIVVIKDGTISEIGSHDQLVAQKGDYARLFALQAKGYK
ncbi:hypothetical protein COT78_03270 [Candidatus Berkelbacteria bacterium CG10_big_fil_rev_8_21_14_0_10_43_13]|uniref:ABC transporter ATP-binding protein n=1 Tax=Candidatus Berkelbacteria bacterium CG10_big_fil_rev_8_21_14_0_10_43_13 TaxID=1974514 RepID=A0A2H0W5X0_9BACT|nr:MAG: hypothetical protein COT78_03270 [Candidatus Berkelbacteria bacterium CG10_big_fil_rev_8_21_14_0_10_43_13]